MGLGTDSEVSVGRLDLLAEARAARSLAPSDAPTQSIELCTLGGARALGLDGGNRQPPTGKVGGLYRHRAGSQGDGALAR